LKLAPELHELATGEPDAREDPNPDSIGGELVEKLDVLRSDSLAKVRPPEALVPPSPFFGTIRATDCYLRQKEEPEGRN
jgi:hypothetical protein